MGIVEEYFNLKEELIQNFNHDPINKDYSIYDHRNQHWAIGEGKIRFAEDKKSLLFNYYERELSKNDKYIYTLPDYTLFMVKHPEIFNIEILWTRSPLY